MNVPQNPATTTGPIPGTAFAIATAGAFRNRMLSAGSGAKTVTAPEQKPHEGARSGQGIPDSYITVQLNDTAAEDPEPVLPPEQSECAQSLELTSKRQKVRLQLAKVSAEVSRLRLAVDDLRLHHVRRGLQPDNSCEELAGHCGQLRDLVTVMHGELLEDLVPNGDSHREELRIDADLVEHGSDELSAVAHDASPSADVVGAHSVGEDTAAEGSGESSAADANADQHHDRLASALQGVHDALDRRLFGSAVTPFSKDEIREWYGIPAAKPAPADSVDRPVVIESDEWWDGYLEACEELSPRGMTAFRVRSILAGIASGAVTFGVLAALEVF